MQTFRFWRCCIHARCWIWCRTDHSCAITANLLVMHLIITRLSLNQTEDMNSSKVRHECPRFHLRQSRLRPEFAPPKSSDHTVQQYVDQLKRVDLKWEEDSDDACGSLTNYSHLAKTFENPTLTANKNLHIRRKLNFRKIYVSLLSILRLYSDISNITDTIYIIEHAQWRTFNSDIIKQKNHSHSHHFPKLITLLFLVNFKLLCSSLNAHSTGYTEVQRSPHRCPASSYFTK